MNNSKSHATAFQTLCNHFFAGKAQNLNANEWLVLTALLHHLGVDGIYPSQVTLAKECRRSRGTINNIVKSLRRKGSILTEKRKLPGKKDPSTFYFVINPETGKPFVHYSKLFKTPCIENDTLPVDNYAPCTVSVPRPCIENDTQTVYTKQNSRETVPTREREQATARFAPLACLSDFKPGEELHLLALERLGNKDLADKCINKFMDYHKGRTGKDWEGKLKAWILNEKLPKPANNDMPARPITETRSTVPFFDSAPLSLEGTGGNEGEIIVDSKSNIEHLEVLRNKFPFLRNKTNTKQVDKQGDGNNGTRENVGTPSASVGRRQTPIASSQRYRGNEVNHARPVSAFEIFTGGRGAPLGRGYQAGAGISQP